MKKLQIYITCAALLALSPSAYAIDKSEIKAPKNSTEYSSVWCAITAGYGWGC